MTQQLRQRNYKRLKLQLEKEEYNLQLLTEERIQGTHTERVNRRARELTESLRRKDLLEEWLPKAFALGKEMRGEVLGDSNRHKRMAKRVYTLFRGREPWIAVNEKWRAKYFEELTQVQAEELNEVWISTELENSLGGDLWTQTIIQTGDVVNNAPQKTRDQARENTPQRLLAGYSLAEPSLAELSLAELSLAELNLAELTG